MLPYHDGKCANMHGHSYRLEVTVAGSLQSEGSATGMVIDFSDVSTIVKQHVIDRLDHTHLNDTVENPTCERLIVWMWSVLRQSQLRIVMLKLWETNSAYATLQIDDAEAAA